MWLMPPQVYWISSFGTSMNWAICSIVVCTPWQSPTKDTVLACPRARQLPAMGLAYCSMMAPGLGDLLHVAGDVQQHRDAAHGAEDAARPQGISDALVHLVLQGDLPVDLEGLHPAHLDHDDDEVGVLQGFAPVQGGPHGARDPVVLQHAPSELLHRAELRLRAAHEGELAAASAGVAMMSAISVLQNTTLPAPIIAIFIPMVAPPGRPAVTRQRPTAAG